MGSQHPTSETDLDFPPIMPHICGPHSNLPNCRYNQQQQIARSPSETSKVWVPIKIQRENQNQETDPNWARKKISSQVRPQTVRVATKPIQSKEEDIFPRKRKSDLYPQM